MSSNNDNLSAFEALVDVAKVCAGSWIVGAALDQAMAGRSTDEDELPAHFAPAPALADAPDPRVEEMLSQVVDMRKQVEELKTLVAAIPTQAEAEAPVPPEPPNEVNLWKPEPVRRGSVEELNAAVLAYNVAARHLGLMVLAGGIDKQVARGELEDAAAAISGVVYAAERLMLFGASLAKKAASLAKQRKDLPELMTSSWAADHRLAVLRELADEIDDLLDD